MPADMVFLGIGENGHHAFNDPHVAFFDDPLTVKTVDLDPTCIRQQVNDGCFSSIDQVPTRAYTITIPELLYVQEALRHRIDDRQGQRHQGNVRRPDRQLVPGVDPAHAPRLHALRRPRQRLARQPVAEHRRAEKHARGPLRRPPSAPFPDGRRGQSAGGATRETKTDNNTDLKEPHDMKVKELRWIILSLIMLVSIINYLDRGTLNYMWVANTKSEYPADRVLFDAAAGSCTLTAEDGTQITVPADRVTAGDDGTYVYTAVGGAGMPDGPTVLGSIDDGVPAIIEDGVAKLPDRSAFAGSVCTTDRVVRSYVTKTGATLPEAVQIMTLTPARLMKIDDRKGSIAPGKDADIVLFDDGINVSLTMIGGRIVYGK